MSRKKSMFERAVESEGAAPNAYLAMLGLPLNDPPARPDEYAAMFKGLGENPTVEEVLGAMRRHLGIPEDPQARLALRRQLGISLPSERSRPILR